MCVGAGLALLLLNVLYRYGAEGDRERDAEEAAREYFAQHGHWPDEAAALAPHTLEPCRSPYSSGSSSRS